MDQIEPEQNLPVRATGSKPKRQDKKTKDKKTKDKPAAAAANAKGNADTKGML
jgi:hypothetical protein